MGDWNHDLISEFRQVNFINSNLNNTTNDFLHPYVLYFVWKLHLLRSKTLQHTDKFTECVLLYCIVLYIYKRKHYKIY